MKKIYIVSEDRKEEKWICDVLKDEWFIMNPVTKAESPEEADIIWVLCDFRIKSLDEALLKKKTVITTIHHIDFSKLTESKKKHFAYVDSVTTYYHTICEITKAAIQTFSRKEIFVQPFWVNENVWKPLENKVNLRRKHGIDPSCYLIGSFQRDTEGNGIKDGVFLPKLEKGPDIFCEIVEEMYFRNPKVTVLLAGWRRQYVIEQLESKGIPYHYFEMIPLEELNEFYNCLDLYLVSSRVEGGPRAITEGSLAKIPIISTDVGVASSILAPESIYSMNFPDTALDAHSNIKYAYSKAQTLLVSKCIPLFRKNIFKFPSKELSIVIPIKDRTDYVVDYEEIPLRVLVRNELVPSGCPKKKIDVVTSNPPKIRLRSLHVFLQSLSDLKLPDEDFEVVITDFQSTDYDLAKLPAKFPAIDFKIVRSDASFSRGKGLNLGFQASTKEFVFFCDADMYFTKRDIFEKAYEEFKENALDFRPSYVG